MCNAIGFMKRKTVMALNELSTSEQYTIERVPFGKAVPPMLAHTTTVG